MEIWAVIPARSGSKGVKDKNIKDFGGKPLLAHSVEIALKSKYITDVVLSTDSEKYKEIGLKAGATVPFLRPKRFSSDSSTDQDFFQHLGNFFSAKSPDIWVHLRPTTPLRKVKVLDNAIETFLKDKKASSMRSVHEAPESPFKWFKNDNGYAKPISESLSLKELNEPRQSFAKVYVPNGYIDIVRNKYIFQESMYGVNIKLYETNYSHEIDTIDDFNYLEFLLDRFSNN